MKKKNTLVLSILSCMLIGASLASCGKNNDHKAAGEWSHDDAYHWHLCETEGHTDKLDYAQHNFGDVMSIQTGDDDASIQQMKMCQDCGFTIYLELNDFVKEAIIPTVNVGDKTSVSQQLSIQISKITELLQTPSFTYREYVNDNGQVRELKSESLSFDKIETDFEDINLSEPGFKEVPISYNGVKGSFNMFLFPDLSKIEYSEYTIKPIDDSIKVYKYVNGYLAFNNYEGINIVYKYDLIDEVNNIISASDSEFMNVLLVLDETNKTIDVFKAESFGGSAITYTIPTLNYSVDVYSKNEKGYCDIYVKNGESKNYYSTEMVQFVGKNIVISNVGIFAIGENNVLTADESSSSYSEEFEKDGKLYRVEFKAEEKAYYIYLVTIDESQVRTKTLIIAIQYVVGKKEMSIFVISFEDRTITRYSVDANNKSIWEIIGNKLKQLHIY